jgi:iron(III) transport system ATP-binding protein
MLSIRSVSCRFDDVAAVENFTLDLPSGKLLALLGPSGCGKTTMLRMIAGFENPSSGTIYMGDRLLSSEERSLPPEQRNMSMIFQSYAVWPNMTVAENVAFGLHLRKLGRAVIEEKLQRVLNLVQLHALRDRYPNQLSGGQQQRVALARALVVDPDVLLLDEPLSNLDANLREEMRSEIKRIHDKLNCTTVYVTHDQREALSTADLVVVMNKGQLEQIGTPEEIFQSPKTRFVAQFIGDANILNGQIVGDSADFRFFSVATRDLRIDKGTASAGDIYCALRPHQIELDLDRAAESAEIVARAVVVEHSYFGETRSYVVRPLNPQDSDPIRVIAPSSLKAERGQTVGLSFRKDALVVLQS